MAEFTLQTAILSDDNTKELRVFAMEDISVQQEIELTNRLCSLRVKKY